MAYDPVTLLILINLLNLTPRDHFRMDSNWRREMANPLPAIAAMPMPNMAYCEQMAADIRSKTELAYCINVGTGQ